MINEPEQIKAFTTLMDKVTNDLNDWLEANPTIEERELMVICYEVMAFHLGYTERCLKNAGMPENDRITMLRKCLKAGGESALSSMKQPMPEGVLKN